VVRLGSLTKVNNNIGFVTENSCSAEDCVNGTRIANGLAEVPNGEVSLTIPGNNYIKRALQHMHCKRCISNHS